LSKWEEARAEPHVQRGNLEIGLAEFCQHPLHVSDVCRLVDHEPFKLVEHRRVRRVRVGPVCFAGNDNADWRLLRFHRANLHRRSVCPQKLAFSRSIRLQEERVVHLARRMPFREVQSGKVIVVSLDVWPFSDLEAQIAKNGSNFVDDLADWMNPPALGWRTVDWQGHVYLLAL